MSNSLKMRGSIDADMSDYYKREIVYPTLIKDYRTLFTEMILANKAHAIMLAEQKIIKPKVAKEILSGLDYVHGSLREEDLTSEKEDFYFNVESALIDRIGRESGGQLHTGRSRNDLNSTIARMVVRKSIWPILSRIIELQELLLEISAQNVKTIMTGYTHVQPAQPTSLAHYLTAYVYVLTRDFERIKAAYKTTNQSPMGSAAFAGTGFPIDRQRTCELLGFDSIVVNSLDGVSSRDYVLETEMAYSLLMSTMSRFAQELYTWVTDEFNLLYFGGEIALQSSIMPQKKNPGVLEFIKGKAGHSIGAAISTFSVLKNMPFSFAMDLLEANALYEQAQVETLHATELLIEVLRHSHLNKERALEMTKNNFCTITALADHLVNSYDIPFREAHEITGFMVATVRKNGKLFAGIDSALLREASKKILGREIFIPQEEIDRVLDPYRNVQSKITEGGPGENSIKAMLEDLKERIGEEKAWLQAAQAQVETAYNKIKKEQRRWMEGS